MIATRLNPTKRRYYRRALEMFRRRLATVEATDTKTPEASAFRELLRGMLRVQIAELEDLLREEGTHHD